jgi:hypothetical protein
MKLKDLAYALKISPSMASRLVKKGMPDHSIEAAEKWRTKNLDPVRTKRFRADGNQGGRKAAAAQPAVAIRQFDSLIQERLPACLFRPLGIAALMHDAGLPVDGALAMRLADCLFMYYATLLDPDGERLQFVIPEDLRHAPGTPEHAAVVSAIDEFLTTL